MEYQNFIKNVKDHVESELHKTTQIYPVLKNNGTILDSLVIHDPTLNISPTIYLEPYFHQHLNGVPIEQICENIIKAYHDHLPKEDFDTTVFTEFEKAQKRIVMKLVNTERNHELLERVPHVSFLDLSIIFLCSVGNYTNEYATILIHNHHMNEWNVSTEDLYELARENTPRILPARLDNLKYVFEYLTNEKLPFLEELNSSILTNVLKIHGATCIAYPNLLEEVSVLCEDDLIIIPSSIHEVIIIPKGNIGEDHTLEDFNGMIQQVNADQLEEHEILSEHAYLYHRDTKEITYKL